MPKNVFDWEPICATLMEGRGPADLPPPALFMSTARALIVNLHQEKKIPIRRLIRDCKEMRDNSGDVFKIQFGNLPVKVIIRRQFFQLTLTWLEGMLQKACETAVAGVDDYDGVPSDQDILNSEPDWEEVTGLEDWVWVEKTDVEA
ncbi:hypothetical protein QC762_508078 [Podospora pseudocomata]|uniref:Uncharacterized protein n=2 Tax=Podospora TaxID=5144 RepID=A0ABR0GCU3_9PEZI|nr:hypothetical protein QC762_508078 [Podospora pseudocomata]KAK4675992.1 hypothetical protein QC764_508078 [Podospora pseudoanserina]